MVTAVTQLHCAQHMLRFDESMHAFGFASVLSFLSIFVSIIFTPVLAFFIIVR